MGTCSIVLKRRIAGRRPLLSGLRGRSAILAADNNRCAVAPLGYPALNLTRHDRATTEHIDPLVLRRELAMREYDLDHDVVISGARCRTLASAAHALRQHAVDYNDFKEWRLARELRDAGTFSQAIFAEQKLHAWLAAAACEKELLHYCR